MMGKEARGRRQRAGSGGGDKSRHAGATGEGDEHGNVRKGYCTPEKRSEGGLGK